MSFGTVQAEKMTTESGYSLGAGNASSFKNRLINGGMVIDQRNAGASSSQSAGGGGYTLDRWNVGNSGTITTTTQQVADAPAGFTYSLKVTITGTGASTNSLYLYQHIEGYNWADMMYGTANAKTTTVSFWVKCSVAGTYNAYFFPQGAGRSYVSPFTVNATNTWEQKTITLTGDVTGTWNSTNQTGIQIAIALSGSTASYATSAYNQWIAGTYYVSANNSNLATTSSATFQLTGVQVEAGTVATSFDFRSFGTELALCQRYYWKNIPDARYSWVANGRQESSYISLIIQFPQIMRAAPTFNFASLTAANGTIGSAVATYAGKQTALYQVTVTGSTTGQANGLQSDSAGVGYLDATAEL